MSDGHREPDWSAWNNWCDSRIDRKRSFDREVLVELVADLKGMIEDQDEKLKAQTASIHNLELKLAELRASSDQRSADHNIQLREHQIAIAELRRLLDGERSKRIDLPAITQRRG